MFKHIFLTFVLVLFLAACATRQVDEGQRLFFGCDIDQRAFAAEGVARCITGTEFVPFDGNGRTCATCHRPEDNFGLSVEAVKSLPADDPLFVNVPGLEDPRLLRELALINVESAQLMQSRHSPKLVHLQQLCDSAGNCEALGLLGDRVSSLNAFNLEAVPNHFTKDVQRRPGQDFRVPTSEELAALTAYMLSDRVATVGGTRK